MTTNNPPIAAWAPSTALHKLESRHNNVPCVLTDGPAEFNDVALVRLADYKALQAAYEEELFQLRQTRDAHFGELVKALEQVDALQAECEKLRKGLNAVQELIDDSYGVAGLHLNGDIAPWSDLLEGGRFEEWLSEFDAAIAEGDGARGGGSNARA